MRPISVTVGPLTAASANNICLSQTPGAAGALTINGALATAGVATTDKPRRVLFTFAGAEATNGTVMTITGVDWNKNVATETVAGVNGGTAQTVYDYATITAISINKAAAGAMTVGTNGVASSRPILLDPWAAAQVALEVDTTGTANSSVQQSLTDPNAVGYTNVNWVNHPDAALVGITGNVQGNYAYAPLVVRLLLNSGTGSAKLTALQSGSVPR